MGEHDNNLHLPVSAREEEQRRPRQRDDVRVRPIATMRLNGVITRTRPQCQRRHPRVLPLKEIRALTQVDINVSLLSDLTAVERIVPFVPFLSPRRDRIVDHRVFKYLTFDLIDWSGVRCNCSISFHHDRHLSSDMRIQPTTDANKTQLGSLDHKNSNGCFESLACLRMRWKGVFSRRARPEQKCRNQQLCPLSKEDFLLYFSRRQLWSCQREGCINPWHHADEILATVELISTVFQSPSQTSTDVVHWSTSMTFWTSMS